MPLSLPAALRTVCLAASLILAPLAAAADKTADAEELLRLVGYDAYSDVISQSFAGIADQSNGAFAPEVIERWPAIVEGRIDADSVHDAAAEALARDVSDTHLAELIAFFSDGSGRIVTEAEVTAQQDQIADPQADAEARAAYLATLDDGFRDRFALYQDLIEALGAVDSGATLAMNVNFAMVSGMIASGLMDPAPAEEDVLAMIAASEEQVRAAVFEALLEDMAWTYRDVPDDDLQIYADLLVSPPGRAMYAALTDASNTIIIDAARAIGHEIMVQMGKTDL